MTVPSAAFTRELFRRETGEAVLVLLELSHPSMVDPILVTSDAVETLHGGDSYLPYAFRLDMPSQSPDGSGRPQLVIENIDLVIIQTLRQIPPGDPLGVTAKVVLGSTPDVVERGPYQFLLRMVTYDANRITGDLSYDDRLEDGYPAMIYTPGNFPGVFR